MKKLVLHALSGIALAVIDVAAFGAAAAAPAAAIVAEPPAASPVADAAQRRDFVAVKELLAGKADVNQPQADGTTALHWAARWDTLDAARLLIKARADVNATTPLGATPLYLAALNGSAPMIELLLSARADARRRVLADESTPLMFAARSGNAESVGLLLKAGADINAAENYRGTSALMWAAERNNLEVVKLLLAHGANASQSSKVTERGTSGKVPARNAAPADPNLAKPQPAAKASGPKDPQGGLTALILAVRENASPVVEALLTAGAPVNQQSGDGSTALVVAVQNVYLDLAKLLIEHGADVNLSNQKGWSPLYLAIKDRSMEYGTMPPPPIDREALLAFIKLLIAKGADTNARVKDDTEMRNAIKATWLNEAGATPFLRASLCGDYTVMKLLLEHGADPKIPTEDGTTALAALSGVGFTKGFMQDIEGPETSLRAIKLLIDSGIDVNAANKDNVTALHGAAHKNFAAAIQLLVDHGGDLTVVSQRRGTFERSKEFKGNTVLDWAYGVQTGGEASIFHPEAVALVEKLLKERNLPLTRFGFTDGGIAGQPASVTKTTTAN
ncbi:MAG: ankyrin repeat domain-containing protein [Gammaproteobacteria bacterium]